MSVFKGDKSLKQFVFHHLREVEKLEFEINGPGLAMFDPKEKKRFLLFLKLPAGRDACATNCP
jgi:hypothetical protein